MTSIDNSTEESLRSLSRKPDMFSCVEENLYLGSYRSICLLQGQSEQVVLRTARGDVADSISDPPDANGCYNDGEIELTKSVVLTVDSRKLPRELTERFSAYKFVEIDDSQQSEFIQHFDECIAFIDEHRRQRRKVLVHCNAGMSRSATVVSAYLMKEHSLDVREAVDMIKLARATIEPNSNFYQQLQLYQTMECEFDSSNPVYRQWRLRLLTQTGFPVVELETLLAAAPKSGANSSDLFCCRICRCPLFGIANQLTHSNKDTGQSDNGVPTSTAPSPPICVQKEIFIEPVVWMKNEITQMDGKLNCPQCRKKVGTFSWVGEKCPCGVFVTPAFHMGKGKVEVRKAIFGPTVPPTAE